MCGKPPTGVQTERRALTTSQLLWIGFGLIITAPLIFDLGVLGRKKSAIRIKESLHLTAGYIAIALLSGQPYLP